MTTTIVALSHNAQSITEKFLDMLFKHTEPSKFCLIMIDNGSTDGTQEYLTETLSMFENPNFVTLALNEQNLGVIGGRNMGYAMFQSDPTDYICFLDNDQFVREGWLEQYHSFMAEGGYDVIGADAWLMDSKFMPIRNCKKAGEPYSYVGCGGMMAKRKVVDAIGLFDEQFNPAYFEDPDFNFRAREAGFSIGWNYAAKIEHLPHQTLGKNPDRMKIFGQSYDKFKKKWNGKEFKPMR
jgi:GT2 family glycosyltransferase